MREALPYKLILLAILALTNVTVLSYLWWRNGSRGDDVTTNAGRLPPLELIDDKGTRVLLSSLIGAPLSFNSLILKFPRNQFGFQVGHLREGGERDLPVS